MKRFLPKREEGQGLVEYALILVLVAVVVIAILLQVGPQLRLAFGKVTAVLQGTGVITAPGGSITGISSAYSPPFKATPSSLQITVSVSSNTQVIVELDTGQTQSKSCTTPSCDFTFSGVGSTGSAVATDSSGGEGVVGYW
jgi:pilus assembly protein Flp/PilA